MLLNADGVSVWEDEIVLDMAGGDGCTIEWSTYQHWVIQSKMVKMVNLMSWIFYYNLRKATQHWKSTIPTCVLSCFSRVRIFAAPRTTAPQAPLSMGFSRQEYWSRLLRSPPGDRPHPGIKPGFAAYPALAGRFFTTSTTWEACKSTIFQ